MDYTAWRTDRIIGWGDPATGPGCNLDNDWSANPLLFEMSLLKGDEKENIPLLAIAVIVATAFACVALVAHLIRSKQ